MLGTFVEIAAPAGSEAAIDMAFAAVAHVHARMSFHEETSDLAALRRGGVGEITRVDAETIAVLRLAIDLHERSAGLFDVTVGTTLVGSGFLPRPPDVDLRRMTGGTADIELIDERHLRCHRPMLIDLGGIAKGHAVDRAIEVLASVGVERAIVNAGGDLRVLGDSHQSIRLREVDGRLGAIIELADAAMASSGSLNNHRVRSGRAVSPHLSDRRTPILSNRAVTVIAGRCVIADAMTKVAFADPVLAAKMLMTIGGEIVPRTPAGIAA